MGIVLGWPFLHLEVMMPIGKGFVPAKPAAEAPKPRLVVRRKPTNLLTGPFAGKQCYCPISGCIGVNSARIRDRKFSRMRCTTCGHEWVHSYVDPFWSKRELAVNDDWCCFKCEAEGKTVFDSWPEAREYFTDTRMGEVDDDAE